MTARRAGPALFAGKRANGGTVLRRAVWTAAVLPALLLAGAGGYVLVEGWSFSDGLYQTAMTVTTVGYREVHPLSQAGRQVTYAVIFAGITWLAVFFATVTSFFIEEDVFHVLRHRRMERDVARLEGHYIVCGAGRTGTQVVAEFLRNAAAYVLVEKDEEQAALLLRDAPHLRLLQGDATRDEVLVRAGIERARGLVAALSDDADNLFVTLTARGLNPRLKIVARANDDDNVAKMYRAGADHVISPQRLGGARMASVLLRPGVVSLLDVVTRGGGVRLNVEEFGVSSGSRLEGRTLGEIEIPQRTGALVMAVKKETPESSRPFLFNPNSTTRVEANDVLIAIGEPEQIEALRRLLAESRTA